MAGIEQVYRSGFSTKSIYQAGHGARPHQRGLQRKSPGNLAAPELFFYP